MRKLLSKYIQKRESKINIHCEICGIGYGTDDASLAVQTTRNFKSHHMKTGAYQQLISMPNGSEIPSSNEVQQRVMVGDQFHIDPEIKLPHDFKKAQEPNFSRWWKQHLKTIST